MEICVFAAANCKPVNIAFCLCMYVLYIYVYQSIGIENIYMLCNVFLNTVTIYYWLCVGAVVAGVSKAQGVNQTPDYW